MTARDKILRLLEEKRLKRSDAAAAAGVAYSTFRTYVDAKRPRMPAADTAARIANFLGVPSSWLFNDAEDWPPTEATAGDSLSDTELVDELLRRRRAILRDLQRLLAPMRQSDALARGEAAAAKLAAGIPFASLAEEEKRLVMDIYSDFQRIVVLVDRLAMLDPERPPFLGDLPPMREVLAGSPALQRWLIQAHVRSSIGSIDKFKRSVDGSMPSLSTPPPIVGPAPRIWEMEERDGYTIIHSGPIHEWTDPEPIESAAGATAAVEPGPPQPAGARPSGRRKPARKTRTRPESQGEG